MKDKATRRPRDPDATREVILEAASVLMAQDGPEAVSLSAVAQSAGVNRGTAYQHFATRENLINQTIAWVSDRMFRAVFGDPETVGERRVEEVDIADMTERLASFAMANHAICRVWLQHVLSSPNASEDMFWREYSGSMRRFAASDLAVPGVDADAVAVMNLAGAFLWPIWASAQDGEGSDPDALAHRYARECLRLSMYGSVRASAYPDVAARLAVPTRETTGD